MKKLLIIISFLFIWGNISAQKKSIDLDKIMIDRSLYPTSLTQLQWMDASSYCWVGQSALIKGTINQEGVDTILKLNNFIKSFAANQKEEITKFPQIKWKDSKSFIFQIKNKLYKFNFAENKSEFITSIPEGAENTDIEKTKLNIAYTVDNNLYMSSNDKQIQLTKDSASTGIVNGSNRVHRNEWGIDKGTFWSPSGKYLAFYRMDESMVTDYPMVDITTRIATLKNDKYPMAGMKSHEVTLGIYDLASAKTIFLKTGEPKDQFLTNITWTPDDKYILIAVLNREQNDMKLNQYDAASGELVKTLFEEKNNRYVEPLHEPYFMPGNPNQFIWQSQRDGWNHLYLYDLNGKLIKQITKGEWVVTDFYGADSASKTVYISCTKDSPIEKQLYAVSINNSKLKPISNIAGTHTAHFNNNFSYCIDQYNNYTTPNEYIIKQNDGKSLKTIYSSENPLRDYDLAKTEVFSIKNNTTDLYCRMIRPPGFDSTRKYPVIVYVYGGPHSQLVNNSWLGGGNLYMNFLAQEGYIVFTLDNRGTANRGFEFESCIHRNVGLTELSDQMKGVEYLKTLSYVDNDRLAVDGWSYGGFMTLTMMLKRPGVFKVATAGGPVIDWKWYEVMYGERYMDTPEENKEGYENNCLLNYVKNLKGKVLIMHGTVDPTVVWQNSLSFIKKCVDEGKQVDYFVFPGHEHNVRGKDRAYMFRKLFEYYKANL
ncbi:MAG: DPP IV N-terminal domain-containing protein [Bacteroidota bacterium]